MLVARSLRILPIVLAALAVAACGSGGGSGSAPEGLPKVTVDEVGGEKVDLSSLTPGKRPLLVWAWSPI